jgi:hypothetical protein
MSNTADLTDSQAHIFAQVQAEMREMLKREEELRQIEADANRNTLESRMEMAESVSRYSGTAEEANTTTTMSRSHSGMHRRSAHSQNNYTNQNETNSTSVSSSVTVNNTTNMTKSTSQRRLPQPPPKKSDSILDFHLNQDLIEHERDFNKSKQ